MCGIVGVADPNHTLSKTRLKSIVADMLSHLKSRGDDHSRISLIERSGVCLGHTPLIIQDISKAGTQPFTSSCGRFTIVFYGEIYNTQQLKTALLTHKNIPFKGTSDTEMIAEMFSLFGVRESLPQLAGMFAIACLDHKSNELYLVRDRMGIKPLYYTKAQNKLYFASELSPIRFQSGLVANMNLNGLHSFLELGYVQQPETILRDVYQVKPGHFIIHDQQGALLESCYWDNCSVQRSMRSHLPAKSENLHTLLKKVVGSYMIADCPLGAYLHGDTGSSLLAALMQSHSSKAIQTFSIGYEDAQFDVSLNAQKIAEHLGTDHQSEIISIETAQNLLANMTSRFDEPFADPSYLSTDLIAEFASQSITVALSSDGGNELFCGHDRYLSTQKLVNSWRGKPRWMKSLLKNMIHLFTENQIDRISTFIPGLNTTELGAKAHEFADVIDKNSLQDAFLKQLQISKNTQNVLQTPGTFNLKDFIEDHQDPDELRWFMNINQASSLLCAVLVKIDRASISHGLEARVPFLDHRIVEFSYAFRTQDLVQNEFGMLPLRTLLSKYVPTDLHQNASMGSNIPLKSWLKGPLKPWVMERLNSESLKELPYLRSEGVLNYLERFMTGDHDDERSIYALAVLVDWVSRKA